MPTEKPRVTFTVSKETLSKIDDYRFSSKAKNQSQAIISLLERALDDFAPKNEKAPSVSDEAMEVAAAYDGADPVIQFGVRKLLDLDVPEIRMVARGSRVKCLSGKPDAKEIDEAIRETPSET
ncbi:hypothetical protein [Dysosmobacter sp.]|uniref:hypothetical protein n=1 Tax=Dysosmobacter sp. TaxID=2591382 RepID=UPI002A86D8F2|nr:hypothetical protein [Dysosmobacter sp.]MDY3984265.1 hypothetical protein [Dysosmobacter sp.]